MSTHQVPTITITSEKKDPIPPVNQPVTVNPSLLFAPKQNMPLKATMPTVGLKKT